MIGDIRGYDNDDIIEEELTSDPFSEEPHSSKVSKTAAKTSKIDVIEENEWLD